MLVFVLGFLLMAAILAQTRLNPCVADNGGGIIASSSYKLLASIGQSVAGLNDDEALDAGYITAELVWNGIIEPQRKPPVAPTIGEFYPNPFNSQSQMQIFLPRSGKVEFELFDMSGKRIHFWEAEKAAGYYTLRFDVSEKMPSGIYLYRISALGVEKKGKVVLAR